MQTITFYSYKGGTGRTLFVANVARYLAQFGQKVFALDFDLEAPGLHYKLGLRGRGHLNRVTKGLVDYVHDCLDEGKAPQSLQDYVLEAAGKNSIGGSIHLMPAGDGPSLKYWHQLARLNWYDLFYADGATGIPLFINLKASIENEFSPDFLLIDSRTGITEIGGVATTLLADQLVCFMLNNQENLEGAREVLRGISRTPRLPGQSRVSVFPILTRIPEQAPRDAENAENTEKGMTKKVRDFLNEEAENLIDTLNVDEIFIFHSEPELQVAESVRVGGDKSPDESPLLRDYLHFLAHLIPEDVIEPFLEPLVHEALAKVLDYPRDTQANLESLAFSHPHSRVPLELIKFYRLCKRDGTDILRTAVRFWKMRDRGKDRDFWAVVRDYYVGIGDWKETSVPPEFVRAVWESMGGDDVKVGLLLAAHYEALAQEVSAGEILRQLAGKKPSEENVIVQYLRCLRKMRQWETAFVLIEKYRPSLSHNIDFVEAWGDVVFATRNKTAAENLLNVESIWARREIKVYRFQARLFSIAQKKQELDVFLDGLISKITEEGSLNKEAEEIGRLFYEFGEEDRFNREIRQSFGSESREFLRYVRLNLSREDKAT